MRERDRIEIRKHRAEVEAIERAEREAAERPVREAEATLKATHAELLKIQRENIRKLKDDDIFVSPALQGVSMLQTEADAQNLKAVNLFAQVTPEYLPYKTPENAQIILDYFDRAGIHILDSDMLRAAFFKLRDLDLLTAIPAPEPAEEPTPEPVAESPAQVQGEEGFDLESGLPRVYTKREVAQMSGDEYRRCFRIYKADLALPTHSLY